LAKDHEPPARYKAWVSHLQTSTAGQWSVNSYEDDTERHSILIFESATAEGTLLSTVGLMDVNISATSERELRTEVLLDHRGHASQEANVLATIAFYVLKNGWRPSPGVVFEEMLTFYLPDGPLPHVLFIPPYQWADSSMTRATVGDLTIYPLLAVPISELERLFVSTQGYEQLQAMWEERQTDVLDWTRAGTI
jgi:hypothetical protein